MQTFLPFANFAASAHVLDRQRLGKQRVETLQIMKVLVGLGGKGWANHPAVSMWRGYESALLDYQYAICVEWTDVRGYRDTCLDKTHELYYEWLSRQGSCQRQDNPPWVGDPSFHAAHRSNLLRKAPEWYGQFGWSDPDDIEYIWPVGREVGT